MMVEEANTTASDQKKIRPEVGWRPGRLGAVAARAPVMTQVSPAATWQALGYLLVVVVSAVVGGRAAGLISALSAALSYDFFLTTPTTP
jgi:K+-sensing histidine kinase KdpD